MSSNNGSAPFQDKPAKACAKRVRRVIVRPKHSNRHLKLTAQSITAENLLVQLDTILKPLNLAGLFPKPQPLEVELGCGDASFLVEYARRNPQNNFIGVERLLGRIQKLDRKGRRAGLTNLRGVRIESAYFLQYLLPPHAASALHIYFPDPWPKKKHRRHRLINERFPELARAALLPGGVVYLRTDDADYFQQMTEVFSAAKNFQETETPGELAEVLTDFEREFNSKGIQTLRAAYRLNL
jgi:tRNA (guanine-N7-)-methyltransferase